MQHVPALRRTALAALAALTLLCACDAAQAPAPAAPSTGLIPAPAPAPAPAAVERPWRGFIRGTLSAASDGDLAFVIEAEPSLKPAPGGDPDHFVFEGEQTLSVAWIRCTATAAPASQPLPPGALVIDPRSSPPTYRLDIGSLWPSTIHGRCANGSASVPMTVPGKLEAAGTLGADGSSFEGRRTSGDLRWEWRFSRQP